MLNEEFEHGYLYSLWKGHLTVVEGEMHKRRMISYPGRIVSYSRIASFYVNGTRYDCNPNPGEIHNAVVWLPERDDKRAKGIMIEYQKQCINKLLKRIDNHKQKIELIEEGLV